MQPAFPPNGNGTVAGWAGRDSPAWRQTALGWGQPNRWEAGQHTNSKPGRARLWRRPLAGEPRRKAEKSKGGEELSPARRGWAVAAVAQPCASNHAGGGNVGPARGPRHCRWRPLRARPGPGHFGWGPRRARPGPGHFGWRPLRARPGPGHLDRTPFARPPQNEKSKMSFWTFWTP